MKKSYLFMLISLALSAGIVVGMVVSCRLWSERPEPGSWFDKYEQSGDIAAYFAHGYATNDRYPLLVRANAFAAETIVRLKKLSPCPILYSGYRTVNGQAVLVSIEPEAHCVAVVLVFEDQQGRLVLYRHPIRSSFAEPVIECEVYLTWLPIDREALAEMGELQEGVLYVYVVS